MLGELCAPRDDGRQERGVHQLVDCVAVRGGGLIGEGVLQTRAELSGVQEGEAGVADLEEYFDEIEGESILIDRYLVKLTLRG